MNAYPDRFGAPCYRISVLVLCASTNRLHDLLPLVPELLKQVRLIRPGQVRNIGTAI